MTSYFIASPWVLHCIQEPCTSVGVRIYEGPRSWLHVGQGQMVPTPDPPLCECPGPVCCPCLSPLQDSSQEVGSFRLIPFVRKGTLLLGYVLRDTRKLLHQLVNDTKTLCNTYPKLRGSKEQSFILKTLQVSWNSLGLGGSELGFGGPAWLCSKCLYSSSQDPQTGLDMLLS